jgi:hypothetical protein
VKVKCKPSTPAHIGDIVSAWRALNVKSAAAAPEPGTLSEGGSATASACGWRML